MLMPVQKQLKILFITSEVVPFVKTGGLADVSAALPLKLAEMGHQVRIIVPKYGAIDERINKIHEVVRLKDIPVRIGGKEITFSMRSSFLVGFHSRVQIYLVDQEEYFGSRHELYCHPMTGEDYQDNDERFILLTKSIFELIPRLGWVPDIIHCNDWQCGLVPAYLKMFKEKDTIYNHIKTVFTIHNISNQGIFPKSSFGKTELPAKYNTEKGVLHKGKFNFAKAALEFADHISTVSPTYSKELCLSDDYAYGLLDVLKRRKKVVHGIINGIDYGTWNPEKDKLIDVNYSLKNIEAKAENKKILAEKFGLEFNNNTPLIGMISRIDDTKGFDLIQKAFKDLMKLNINLVILGTGNRKYHRFFEEMAVKYREKFSCYLGFDDELAHKIEAGADILLMPSKYEPCGLNQMYSLVYGTVPLVRETGGLADTVKRFNEKSGLGNGFSFKDYKTSALLSELKRALTIYKKDKGTWLKIISNGMISDFSWKSSAMKYVDLYKKVLSEK
jgi:starch synthase